MKLKKVFDEIKIFTATTHGSSNFNKDEYFVKGRAEGDFAPLKYLEKKIEGLEGIDTLEREGFICDSYDLYGMKGFAEWFETQFSRKLSRVKSKKIYILYLPDDKTIFSTIANIDMSYQILKKQRILLNSKKLQTQIGEWYARSIFGLTQVKTTSQRGFDFHRNGRRVEVRVEWGDKTSLKGVKLRKGTLELCEYVVIIYVASRMLIRDICFLDSEYVLRKFSGKGHTIFLKDSDVSSYFFSNHAHHAEKVINPKVLLKYASPTFAMKISETFYK